MNDRKRLEIAVQNTVNLAKRIGELEEQMKVCVRFLEHEARREALLVTGTKKPPIS